MKRALPSLATLLLRPRAAPGAADRHNILFLFADDWGRGDLSCHGHRYLKTPNLDRPAAAGIDFQQFNVLNPVCSPSRAADRQAAEFKGKSPPPLAPRKTTVDRTQAFERMHTK